MTNIMESIKTAWQGLKENKHFARFLHLLPDLNFISIHYIYFISLCLITSVIFYLTSDPAKSISYTDSLFLVVSAMTEAGLNTVNLSQMTLFQQIILFCLIVLGSSILVSISTVIVRKRVFEKRFQGIIRRQKEAKRARRRDSMSIRGRSLSRGQGEIVPPVIGKLNESRRMDESSDQVEQLDGSSEEPEEHHLGLGNLGRKRDENDKGRKLDGADTTSTATAVEQPFEPADRILSQTSRRQVNVDGDRISPALQFSPSPNVDHPRIINFVGVGAHPNSTSAYKPPNSSGLAHRRKGEGKDEEQVHDYLDHTHYPSYLTRHTTGRNAQFYGLNRAERDHLGGVEYRAISLLAWVIPIYFASWQILGCVALGGYIANNKAATSEQNGINPWWLGVFNGVSAFNNSGMSLLDANMIPFQTSIYTLLTMGLLILAGNTAYPLFLRLILWTMLRLLCLIYPDPNSYPQHKATLRFILRYPRRVYTNLFPSAPTWWLLFMLIVLNGIDWVAFELLNLNNPATESIPARYRLLDGLFQALAVRSGGFYVIAIPSLRVGLQVLYVIMMYISVYPVVITMRHSNVYEERSLGIYSEDAPSDDEDEGVDNEQAVNELPKFGTLAKKFKRTFTVTLNNISTPFVPSKSPVSASKASGKQFVRQQIRGQLAHDLWWLVLAIWLISCIEGTNFEADPATFSIFNIIFEVVSAYGCVGISVGLPTQAYSFCGAWHKTSKLILCAVMLRGRHRGLPVALDRAVRLPEESSWSEESDRELRRSFTERRGSLSDGRRP